MTDEETRAHTSELVAALTVEHARIKRKRDASEQMLQALKAIVDFCDDPNGSYNHESLACGLARMLPDARSAIRAAEGC